jgi:arsenate reductase
MTTIYHNPRCGMSRKGLAKLEEGGITPEIVLYLKAPLTAADLSDLLERLDDPPADLVRKDNRFRELGLDRDDYTTKRAVIDLLVEHPELMQRPVIDDGTRAFIGRPLDRVEAFTKS